MLPESTRVRSLTACAVLVYLATGCGKGRFDGAAIPPKPERKTLGSASGAAGSDGTVGTAGTGTTQAPGSGDQTAGTQGTAGFIPGLSSDILSPLPGSMGAAGAGSSVGSTGGSSGGSGTASAGSAPSSAAATTPTNSVGSGGSGGAGGAGGVGGAGSGSTTNMVTPTPPSSGSGTVADTSPRWLTGEWQGFCGHRYDNPDLCEYGFAAPMNTAGACPSGYERVHVGARLQLNDNDARNEAWSATCVRSGTPSAEQIVQPSSYAREGGVYGLCVYSSNSSSCNVATMFPMVSNKTCPTGFTFTHMGARYNGRTEHWYAACIAQSTGPRMVRETGGWRGLCAYDYNGEGCKHAALGGIAARGVCPAGTRWLPFVARFNGRNEIWAGSCISVQ